VAQGRPDLFIYYCYLHYLMQKCMSCLLGETGASIMGVQEPLASKGILVFPVCYLRMAAN
jgi:hypothetical protein